MSADYAQGRYGRPCPAARAPPPPRRTHPRPCASQSHPSPRRAPSRWPVNHYFDEDGVFAEELFEQAVHAFFSKYEAVAGIGGKKDD